MSGRDLIEALASMQKANAWTDGEVARRLQIDRSTWSMLRRGKRKPGTGVLGGIQRAFPDMTAAVSLFLDGSVTRNTAARRAGTDPQRGTKARVGAA